MTLSEYALKNRYTVYALVAGAVIFGVISYMSLPIQLFPDTAPPLVNVLTPYPGAAAEDVADMVSDPIEAEAASLEGVYRVTSTSQNGLSLVAVEFRYGVSSDLAAVDVQNAVSRIRAGLPREIGEPQVLRFSTSNRPVLTMGLRGERLADVRRLAEEELAPYLQRLPGVALVDVFGGYRPEISVHVDRNRLEAHRLPLAVVVEAIRSHNVSIPAGEIRGGGMQYSFRVDTRSDTVRSIASIPVSTPSGRRVLVGDLAEVEEGAGEDLSRFLVNGNAAIAVQIFKQDDANTVEVVAAAREGFAELSRRYPGIRMELADESASFTRQVVSNMLEAVGQALLLATVIIFLFLGSFRRGLVVAVSMPMSFLLTFSGMKLVGIQVDLVTLTAIILAVGMVVDASVVVLENITRRYREEKLSPFRAALEGAKEIQFSVIAGNATTLVVLVPLLFLYGFVGRTFGPLSATLIIAFLSSLLVALTLVPILTMAVTKDGGRLERLARIVTRPWERLMDHVRRFYVRLLALALRARTVVLFAAFGLFAAGLFMLRAGGMELLPKMDGGSTFVTVETRSGSSLDETERVMREVERIILEEPDLENVSTQIGFEPGMHSFGGGGVQGPTQGYVTITWTPRTEREESIWEIQDRLRGKLSRVPNIENLVVRESGSTAKATTASSIVISIRGDDPLVLDRLGDEVLAKLASVPGAVNAYRSWRRDQRTIALRIDTERARELGLSPDEAARELVQALDGMSAGVFRGGEGEDTPIRVRYAEPYRRYAKDVYEVRILSEEDGVVVPMRAVAEGRELTAQGLVTRENLQPTIDILALHQGRPLSLVSADVETAVAAITVPQGYTVTLEGENRDMEESRDEIIGALAISLIAVYLLLVAQFRSFAHPVTVLMSVPLSLVGVAIALKIAGMPVSMPVLVGLILLAGIVVNNAIILIDFIRQRRDAGVARREAILGSVETRFRPIMMTSLSTIVGMLPLALEIALGAERFSPLAVAVIGGMTASTFLTLIVIPVLFDAFEDAGARIGRLVGKTRNEGAVDRDQTEPYHVS